MTNFPLYDTLEKDIPDKNLTGRQKSIFIKNMEKMDQYGYDNIYILIKVYYLQNSDEINEFVLPYGGVSVNGNENTETDLRFDIDKFPNKLNQILYKFCQLHLKSKTNCV